MQWHAQCLPLAWLCPRHPASTTAKPHAARSTYANPVQSAHAFHTRRHPPVCITQITRMHLVQASQQPNPSGFVFDAAQPLVKFGRFADDVHCL